MNPIYLYIATAIGLLMAVVKIVLLRGDRKPISTERPTATAAPAVIDEIRKDQVKDAKAEAHDLLREADQNATKPISEVAKDLGSLWKNDK